MRTIIAGSRGLGQQRVDLAMALCGWMPTVVISGTARGVDQCGEAWAAERGIPVERYPADWDQHGKRAGYIRNELMATKADALVAVWDCQSRGTKHMINIAEDHGLRVFVYRTVGGAA
jgi:hypothetical protein